MTPIDKIERLRELLASATPGTDVQVSWYFCEGINHPQFETREGRIAQDDTDYELYCAARNSLPALLDVAEAALRMSCCDYDCGEDSLECNLARALARLAEGQ